MVHFGPLLQTLPFLGITTPMSVDLDNEEKPKMWQIENSWGAQSGFNGTLIMTGAWFNEYMFRLVVDKKYVPAKVLDVLKQKPTMLPAWDPMFTPEEQLPNNNNRQSPRSCGLGDCRSYPLYESISPA